MKLLAGCLLCAWHRLPCGAPEDQQAPPSWEHFEWLQTVYFANSSEGSQVFQIIRLRIPPVAMLIPLAASAGAILVAADLAPAGGVLRIAIGGSRCRHRRGFGKV